ncbi:MAG TPA: DUF3095 family protein [Rariglobus sp.]|nr:DUF3095 family protein [Rariglobus sp.]
MTSRFYENLPESAGLAALLRGGRLEPVPDGTWLVCADVRMSTKAIADGKYKDVNLAGAACITAVLNACRREDLPFIFGGDGAMLLVGGTDRDAAKAALVGTVRMAREALGLEMRAGLVPVRALREAGEELRVGRVRMSDGFHQAAFMGGAAALADAWLKAGDARVDLVDGNEGDDEADFGGLECRWQGVRPVQGGVAALIVEPRKKGDEGRAELAVVLREVEAALGSVMERRPVSAGTLKLAQHASELEAEARVHAGRMNPPWWTRWVVRFETAMGRLIMARKVKFAGADWGRYKDDAAANTDFEKLDDALRMVAAAGPEAVERLRAKLDAAVKEGRIWYGLEVSEECRMTCLVFVRGRQHFHFVDGAGGGYAAAASALKAAKAAART